MPYHSACYCMHLRRAAGAITALYDDALAPSGLTVTQFSLLRHLQRLAPCCVSTLAESLGLERTTLTRTLRPLIARGLIGDTPSQHGHSRSLTLTDIGSAQLEKAVPLWEQVQRQTEARFGAERLRALQELSIMLTNESHTTPGRNDLHGIAENH